MKILYIVHNVRFLFSFNSLINSLFINYFEVRHCIMIGRAKGECFDCQENKLWQEENIRNVGTVPAGCLTIKFAGA